MAKCKIQRNQIEKKIIKMCTQFKINPKEKERKGNKMKGKVRKT
jgi:hypothetical protein